MRARREELGLSQEELGRRLGTTLRTYARWERGETYGYMTQLTAIAKALETDASELLAGDDRFMARPTIESLAVAIDELAQELRGSREDLDPLITLSHQLQRNGSTVGSGEAARG